MPPEAVLDTPMLALASATLTLPGAVDTESVSALSLGPGSRTGAGSGGGGGDGPGSGPGLRAGDGGNVGGGKGAGANLIMPIVLHSVTPRYTAEAMRARLEGSVLVGAIVHADGSVRDVRVIRSLDSVFGLDQAAVHAARQWRFRPGLIAGEPVSVAITIQLSFTVH
jgi:protein TonB